MENTTFWSDGPSACQGLTHTISFHPHEGQRGRRYYTHFPDKETEAQKSKVVSVCSRGWERWDMSTRGQAWV